MIWFDNRRDRMIGFTIDRKRKVSLMVEFVGASGVGKSYLLARLSDVLRARGATVIDFDSISIRRSLLDFNAIGRAAYCVLLIRPALIFRPHFIRKLAAHFMKRKTVLVTQGIHLCCDGIFHKMRGLYRNGGGMPMENLADLLFRFIEPPDVVVVVEASPTTIYNRRATRARRHEQLNFESVKADVELLKDNIRTIGYVQNGIAPRLRMLRANVEDSDISLVTVRIADELQRILANS